jgi:hypothetical protein
MILTPRLPETRRTLLLLLSALALTVGVPIGLAVYSGSAAVSGNSFTTDTLNAPTGLSATGGGSVSLSWTATADIYASGYNVLRGTTSGGPYSEIAQVTPRTATSYVDLASPGTYYYVLASYYQNWASANSAQAIAGVSTNTGLLNCSANAPVASSAGDNNGFELNPGNGCADDGAWAEDNNSGTGTGTSCTGTGKDKHLYYNYNVSVPAGSTINGIEVRLDGWADATSNTPRYCVDLSWNGGTSWTTAKAMSADLTTSEATYILGASNDTWGRTWAVGELTNANLRVRVISRASSTARNFRLEWIAPRVTYTPP